VVALTASLWLVLGSLGAAVVLTVAAESCAAGRGRRLAGPLACAALLACYLVCVGLLSALLSWVLSWRQWVALAVAVPAAFPLLLLAARASEA
jgi:hypothetical protein